MLGRRQGSGSTQHTAARAAADVVDYHTGSQGRFSRSSLANQAGMASAVGRFNPDGLDIALMVLLVSEDNI